MTQGMVIKKKMQYLLIIHHRQLTIECPIFEVAQGGSTGGRFFCVKLESW